MFEAPETGNAAPFEDAGQMRRENANLLEEMEDQIGQDSSVEREKAALGALEPRIRAFMQRGAATGVFVEEIPERTACQVLLDYWSSTLSHAGMPTARPRLTPFEAAKLPDLKDKGCPYVGLDAFRDPTFFFGREKAVESLLERLADVQLVIVQGASGSGKSSLVIAGAVPALASGKRLASFRVIGPLTPGNAPLENLADALAAVMPDAALDRSVLAATLRETPDKIVALACGAEAPPTAIVVDQFEEVFTLCSEADRGAFVALIAALLQARRDDRVLLTLREEFSGEMDRLEPLAPLLAQRFRFSMQEWRMGYAELRAAIERPAALVNLHFSPGIVDDLVRRVVGLDAALPLLQFALKALWNTRDRNRITREVYERIGGSPLVALERYADGLFGDLTTELQVEVRRILLELVRIDRLLEPYRQQRLRSELLRTGSPRTPEALKQLELGELVRVTPTADGRDAIVDVAHEALLRNWSLYARWIDDKREQERERIAVKDAAARWAGEHQRSRSEGLLSPWQLVDAKRLAGLDDDSLVRDYLQVCADAADAERRRQIRRSAIRSAAGILVLFLIVGLVGASVLAWRERTLRGVRNAEMEIYRATGESHQGQIGRALPDAVEAAADASSLLVEAWPRWWINFWADRPALRGQLRRMLLSVLRDAGNLNRVFVRDGVVFRAVAFRPGQTGDSSAVLAFGGSDGKVYLDKTGAASDAGKPLPLPLDGCAPVPITTLAFDPTGRWMAAGCANGALNIWSAEDWKRRSESQLLKTRVTSLSVSRDGRLVAAGAISGTDKNGAPCCSIALVSLNDAGELGDEHKMTWQAGHPSGGVWAVAFSPKEDKLLVGEGNNGLSVCKPDVSGPWTCSPIQDRSEDDAILALAYSPDGQQAAVGHWRGSVDIWDANSLVVGPQLAKPNSIQLADWYSPVYAVDFFEACSVNQLAIAKGSGLQYWPLSESTDACAKPRRSPIGDWVDGVAFDPASGLLAAASGNGYVATPVPAGDTLRTNAQKDRPSPVRGALVAEQGETAWLAAPVAPRTDNDVNLALFKLRDGAVVGEGPAETVAAGNGKILRVSASAGARLLAALSNCL
jgi:NACHT domain/WD domain, G-beta repeat